MKGRVIALSAVILLALVTLSWSEDRADLAAILKIKDEGINRSQVMTTISYLTDVYRPRLAGSLPMGDALPPRQG